MSTEVDIATCVWRNIAKDRMMLIAAGGDALQVRRIERAAKHPREVRAAPESSTGISSDMPLTKISPGACEAKLIRDGDTPA